MRAAGFFFWAVLAAASASLGASPPVAELDTAMQRGIEFLLRDQNRDGSWGSPHRTKGLNIYAPMTDSHQAFRSAVTALCVEALLETGAAGREERAREAMARGEQWLLENLPTLRRATPDAMYNIWSHAYGIQALAKLHPRSSTVRKRQIEKVIRGQIQLLRRYESVDGGWGYYDFRVGAKRPAADSISFTTATVLVALHQAQQIGVRAPASLVQRAVASIQRQRKRDSSYLYGEYLQWQPMMDINRPAGSLGRSQVCNLALRLWGDEQISDEVVAEWLERLIARNDWLSMGRKRPVPHESWFQVAGYFYYYGHYYAAFCAELLAAERARPLQDALLAVLLPLQEADGSWWDYPLYNYHQQYGTAFALTTLARLRPRSE